MLPAFGRVPAQAAGGIEGSPQFQALPEDQQAELREWLELLTDIDFAEMPARPQKTGLPEAT